MHHLVVRARWLILALLVALSAWLLPGLGQVREDNDVLAFLPPDHPDVVAFHEVASRFGMLEVALVGLGAAEGDMLSVERVATIRELTRRVSELEGVRVVLSFTDLPNPEVKDDGLEVAPLVPTSLVDEAAIRERVLSSTDAVGNFISADGRAAALLVFLIHEEGDDRIEQRARRLAAIRATVGEIWPEEHHFGGAPFVEEAAAQASRADIERLSPVVIGVLVVVSGLLLGSLTAAFLNVFVTGLGVALIMGAHGVFGEPLTIVSSSIPVMMVALGGAFGVHIIAGYQRQAEGSSKERAVATLRELASPVLLSGLTTAVAFFALVVMPQVPMQRFGVAAGIGVLILLCLSLLVMPALLSLLPERLIKPRPERSMPLRGSPRALVLLLIAAVGLGVGFAFLRADPDTSNVFTDSSEPSRANEFFNEHFGGSTYLQIAIEGDLREPAVLRAIRDLEAEIRAIDGVVDVRSVMQPVAILTEAMGGRAGVPETPGRAGSVLTLLSGHPAMAQLMTDDGKGGLVHIKLAPLPGDRQVEISRRVRELVEETRSPDDKLRIVDAGAVAEQRGRDVGEQLALALGAPVDVAALTDLFTKPSPELLKEIAAVRDKALTSEDDSPVDPADVSLEEVAALDPAALIRPRDAALEALLRERLPTLAEKDAAGVGFVAKHLGPWIDEVLEQRVVAQRCAVLGLDASAPAEDPKSCKPVRPLLAELDDREWSVHSVPEGVTAARELEFSVRLTGQPVIGEAFADSVTRSLMESTLVSLVGLAVVLLLARQLVALAPALWTLCVTLGLLAVFGMPISVGTSMIACIALGAGVDFAIHLGARARRIGGGDSGRRAVEEIGAVILISALQLALAFMVLLASEMQPLRDFGAGLAIGLVGAAVGACWLVPLLYRGRSRKTRTDG